MTIQPDLFDPDSVWEPPTTILDIDKARELRDKAIVRVDLAADPTWKKAADFAIRAVAYERAEFTTDEVWQTLHELAVESPHEPRALGAAMKRAARDGLISATNKIEQSARAVCHAAPKRVWRSMLVDA